MVEYYSTIKRMIYHRTKWAELEDITVSKTIQTPKTSTACSLLYVDIKKSTKMNNTAH